MNIISNNCLAGYIYREILKTEYQNPFIWSRIWEGDFLTLVNNFTQINFNNFELKKKNKDLSGFYLRIDNKFDTYYRHDIFSAKDKKPRIENNCVYYCKIWEYLVDKYKKRVKRMKEKPIFIVENLHKDAELIDACKKNNYRLLLLTNEFSQMISEDLVILPHDLNTSEPLDYVNKYKNEIKQFIHV